MGNIQILCVGKLKEKHFAAACAEYQKRLSAFCKLTVTELPEVKTGDIVTVFGDDPTADELGSLAGTIAYELLCAVSPRVPRVYLNE